MKYYLGLEVHRNVDGIIINQHKFILDLLEDASLQNAKPLSLPVDQNTNIDNPSLYRRFVGKLLYLTNTRPDIVHIFHHLSKFQQAPKVPHFTHLH